MSVGKTMILSEVDHKILESYKTVLEGLADYLGDGCEIALHSLEDYDKSVIKIVNGHHTGREVGAPITNLALEMLDKIKKDGARFYISYFAKNKRGNPIKSATIAIKGEHERIIGLLCININLNMPMLDFLSVFCPIRLPVINPHPSCFPTTGKPSSTIFYTRQRRLWIMTLPSNRPYTIARLLKYSISRVCLI